MTPALSIVRSGYLTRAELAGHLHVSARTIQRWEREGLPVEVWGARLHRYRLDRAEDWLSRRKAA